MQDKGNVSVPHVIGVVIRCCLIKQFREVGSVADGRMSKGDYLRRRLVVGTGEIIESSFKGATGRNHKPFSDISQDPQAFSFCYNNKNSDIDQEMRSALLLPRKSWMMTGWPLGFLESSNLK